MIIKLYDPWILLMRQPDKMHPVDVASTGCILTKKLKTNKIELVIQSLLEKESHKIIGRCLSVARSEVHGDTEVVAPGL